MTILRTPDGAPLLVFAVDVLTGEVNPFEALVGAEELIGVMEGDIVFWFVISVYHEKVYLTSCSELGPVGLLHSSSC
jgi:hypothetical protein